MANKTQHGVFRVSASANTVSFLGLDHSRNSTMTTRQRFFAFGTSLAVFTGGLWLAAAWAQEAKTPAPEKLLPADAVLYIGWDGTDAHRAAWEKTAAHNALVTNGLGEVLSSYTEYAESMAGGAPIRQMVTGLEKLAAGGFQMVVGIPNSGDGPPSPQVTIVVPGGAAAIPEIKAMLANVPPGTIETEKVGSRVVTRGQPPEFSGAEIGWWAEGKHLVVAIGPGAVDTALNTAAGKAPSIETSAVWKKYRPKADFDVALTAWLDLAQARKVFGGMPVSTPRPGQGQSATVNDILKTLGLDRIGSAAMRVGFKGKALWTETTIEAPSPREGLLAWDAKPITLEDLPPLPAGTDGFYAGRMNWSSAGKGLVRIGAELSRLLDGEDAPSFDEHFEVLQRQLGVDFQRDLFESLGDVLVVYGDTRQGVLGLGSGLAIAVDDAKTLRETLDKLTGRLMQGGGGPMLPQIQAAKRSGRTMTYIDLPGFPVITPSWAVDDKWLIFGLSPQTVDVFLRRVDGKLDRWTPPPEVKSALAEMPTKYTSLTYSDPRDGYRTALGAAPMIMSWFTMRMQQQMMMQQQFGGGGVPAMAFVSPISVVDLPPGEVVTQSLFPNVSVGSQTDKEFRWTSRTSLPAVPFLGGAGIGSAGSSAPVLAAMLLPAVGQAREAARRSQSKNNLKQIGLALHNYHDAHNQFPAGTVENEKLKPEERLSWQAEILPYIDQAQLYNQIDFEKGWEAEGNLGILKNQIPVYLNPGVPGAVAAGQIGRTHYVGLAGIGKDGPLLKVVDAGAGFFGYDRACSIRDILDGTSNTIMVSEANKDFGGWGTGGPNTVRALTKKPYINGPDGLGGPWRGGMHVLFADGSVRFISENIDPDLLEKLTTIAGGEIVGAF
jgi:prepilin-type processing-associated H-X9-DG protein